MNIFSVIPLVKLPEGKEEFDYFLPEKAKTKPVFGNAVLIRFRNKNEVGIVIKEKKSSKIPVSRLHPIKKNLSSDILLEPNSLELYKKFARFYHISLPHALTIGLPSIPRQLKPQTPFFIDKKKQSIPTSLSTPCFFEYHDISSLKAKYQTFFSHAILQKKPLLLICPSKQEAEYMWSFVSKIFPQVEYADASIARIKLFRLYQHFFSGKIPILVGTRKLIFWHSHNPYTLLLHNAQDISYKQYRRSPRYDCVIIFQILSKTIPHCNALASGSSIPLALLKDIHEKKIKYEFLQDQQRTICVRIASKYYDDKTLIESKKSIFVHHSGSVFSPLSRLGGKYEIVIMRDFNTLANINFFNAWEQTLHTIAALKFLLKTNGKLIILTQTYDHPIFNKDFLYNELKKRKQFNLPPYKKMLKLSYTSVYENKKLIQKLHPLCLKGVLNYKISHNQKEALYILLIPIFNKKQEDAIFTIIRNNRQLNIQIDINPISLI